MSMGLISRSISMSPLDYEITRVSCTSSSNVILILLMVFVVFTFSLYSSQCSKLTEVGHSIYCKFASEDSAQSGQSVRMVHCM